MDGQPGAQAKSNGQLAELCREGGGAARPVGREELEPMQNPEVPDGVERERAAGSVPRGRMTRRMRSDFRTLELMETCGEYSRGVAAADWP